MLLLIVTFDCCEKEYDNQIVDEEEKVISCFKILDADSSNPIEGAHVRLSGLSSGSCDDFLWGYCPIIGWTNISDSSGNCCIEHHGFPPHFDVTKAGYVHFCWQAFDLHPLCPPDTVYLDPAASIQFHIQNIPPRGNDEIFVYYPGVLCGGSYREWQDGPGYIPYDTGGSVIKCLGPLVDTTLIVDAFPGNIDIHLLSYHNGRQDIDSTQEGIITKAHDTIFFEILY
jgi:hypothetical protein